MDAGFEGPTEAVEAWCATVIVPSPDAPGDSETEDGKTKQERAAAAMTWLLTSLEEERETLPDLIANVLGPHLTNSDDCVRARAVELMAQLLQGLPGMTVPPGVVSSLMAFFTDRFADFRSLGHCLTGVDALVRHHSESLYKRGSDQAPVVRLVQSLVASGNGDLHWPAMNQPLRFAFFSLLQSILEHVPTPSTDEPAVVSAGTLGGMIMEPFIDSFEGEKDPRVLMVCLRLSCRLEAAVGSTEADAGGVKREMSDGRTWGEALVEVLSMYFPITFTPPPNDPHGITKPLLTSNLREALVGPAALSSGIAKAAVPMLLEHLSMAPGSLTGGNSHLVALHESLAALSRAAESLDQAASGGGDTGASSLQSFLRPLADALLGLSLNDRSPPPALLPDLLQYFAGKQVAPTAAMEPAAGPRDAGDSEVDDNGAAAAAARDSLEVWVRCLSLPGSKVPPGPAWQLFVDPVLLRYLSEVDLAPHSLRGTAAAAALAKVTGASAKVLGSVMSKLLVSAETKVGTGAGSKGQLWTAQRRASLDVLTRVLLASLPLGHGTASDPLQQLMASEPALNLSRISGVSITVVSALAPYASKLVELLMECLREAATAPTCVDGSGMSMQVALAPNRAYGIASESAVAAAAAAEGCVWLDVRSAPEVAQQALPSTAGVTVVHRPVSMADASGLEAAAAQLLPRKDAPIIVFCAVGGRASVAKTTLESLGYTQVLNGGGIEDVLAIANSPPPPPAEAGGASLGDVVVEDEAAAAERIAAGAAAIQGLAVLAVQSSPAAASLEESQKVDMAEAEDAEDAASGVDAMLSSAIRRDILDVLMTQALSSSGEAASGPLASFARNAFAAVCSVDLNRDLVGTHILPSLHQRLEHTCTSPSQPEEAAAAKFTVGGILATLEVIVGSPSAQADTPEQDQGSEAEKPASSSEDPLPTSVAQLVTLAVGMLKNGSSTSSGMGNAMDEGKGGATSDSFTQYGPMLLRSAAVIVNSLLQQGLSIGGGTSPDRSASWHKRASAVCCRLILVPSTPATSDVTADPSPLEVPEAPFLQLLNLVTEPSPGGVGDGTTSAVAELLRSLARLLGMLLPTDAPVSSTGDAEAAPASAAVPDIAAVTLFAALQSVVTMADVHVSAMESTGGLASQAVTRDLQVLMLLEALVEALPAHAIPRLLCSFNIQHSAASSSSSPIEAFLSLLLSVAVHAAQSKADCDAAARTMSEALVKLPISGADGWDMNEWVHELLARPSGLLSASAITRNWIEVGHADVTAPGPRSKPGENRLRALHWLLRGILVRRTPVHSSVWQVSVSTLLSLITSEEYATDPMDEEGPHLALQQLFRLELGVATAQGLEVITDEVTVTDQTLQSPLWRQRLWGLLFPPLHAVTTPAAAPGADAGLCPPASALAPPAVAAAAALGIAVMAGKTSILVLAPHLDKVVVALVVALRRADSPSLADSLSGDSRSITTAIDGSEASLTRQLRTAALSSLILLNHSAAPASEDSTSAGAGRGKAAKRSRDGNAAPAAAAGDVASGTLELSLRTLTARHGSLLLEMLPRVAGFVHPQASTARIRAMSLIVLWQLSSSEEYSSLDPTMLLPHHRVVMKALLKPLDDPNRDVRRLAAKLRNVWATIAV